jgi:CRP/FNR family transcriptional regulator, cyclic AMP receptor protein
METGALGKIYHDGEVIVRQGEPGDCMFVIQAGEAEVLTENDKHQKIRLALLRETDFFGEMALFDREVRSATVRAVGEARVLTVDRKTFLRRVHEDPSLAFRILEQMSHRIRAMDAELTRLQSGA